MLAKSALRFFAIPLAIGCLAAHAGEPNSAQWSTPPWVDATASFEGAVKIAADAVSIHYVYPDGAKGQVKADRNEDGTFAFRIPGAHDPQIGKLELSADLGNDRITHHVPLAYVEELDITGNPPVVLPYPLADESHLIRYIPCCNIFGGVMMASRIPVNPMDTAEGLPRKLLSDFVVIEPDELTTSTAGTHMRFTIDSETDVALYTYNWKLRQWREALGYDVNAEEKFLEVHCPEGGTFVLGTKLPDSKAVH